MIRSPPASRSSAPPPRHPLTPAPAPAPTPPKTHPSSGTFYQRGHDKVITRIEERVAAATMVPVENQEGLQILHYENGQKYGEPPLRAGSAAALG
jgi:hypothetical protein